MNPLVNDIIKKIKTALDDESTDAIRGRCASVSFESNVISDLDNTKRNYYGDFKRFLKSNLETKEALLKEALSILESMQPKEVPIPKPAFVQPTVSNGNIIVKSVVVEVDDKEAEIMNIKQRMLNLDRWNSSQREVIMNTTSYGTLKDWEKAFLTPARL